MLSVKNWLITKHPTVQAFVFYDDFLICGKSKNEAEWAMQTLLEVLKQIGIRINKKKTQFEATQSIEWLGLTISNNKTLSAPKEKIEQLKESWKAFNQRPTVELFLRFIGRANFMSKIAPGARTLLRMLNSCVPDEYVISKRKQRTYCDPRRVYGSCQEVLTILTNPKTTYKMELRTRTVAITTDAS